MIEEVKMGKRQIIKDLNRLYEEVRAMISVYNQFSPVTADAISEISQKLSKAIAHIERAERAEIDAAIMK